VRPVFALVLCACSAEQLATGERWTDPDALFNRETRWLGGDGAYTIDLGDDRTLWLFGDSFVATSPALVRTESTIVRNSVAVMTGRDPRAATMQFAWRDGTPPTSFFPEAGDHWFWPSDGVRVAGGPLLVFLSEQRATPGDGLGFANAGWAAVRVADPSGPPGAWVLEPASSHAVPFAGDASVACSAVDGDSLVALFVTGDSHDGHLARWPLADVAAADLSQPAWWSRGAWVAEAALAGAPDVVIGDGSTECSLSRHADDWIYVESRGFGSTMIAIRRAPALEGPWSDPSDVLEPPESRRDDAFVYAGKGHANLDAGADFDLAITFADNSFTFADLFDPANVQTLGWPHFVRIAFR